MNNQHIYCNNIILLLDNKNNDKYLEFIKKLERNNYIVSIFYEDDFKEELINEILISLKDFYLISFTNTKETHDYILNTFKNKIIKRVYCGFNHNIIDINIPTLILYGDEDKKYFSYKIAYKTFIKFKNNQNYKLHYGHGFCESFYNGEWVLVDATCKKCQTDYDIRLLHLPYSVNGNNEFIPYLRNLDLNVKQSIKEYHNTMDELCLKL